MRVVKRGGPPGYGSNSPVEAKWWAFHLTNPHVYRELTRITKEAHARGVDKFGIDGVFAVARYESAFHTVDEHSDFKLSNNYKPYYARHIMANNEGLEGFFTTRELKV